MINWIRNKLMSIKLCVNRSVSYLSMANSAMILFLLLSNLKERGYITLDLNTLFFPLLIIGFVLLVIFGWLEMYVFHGAEKEQEFAFALTPPLVEMKRKVDEMYKTIKKIENEKGVEDGHR